MSLREEPEAVPCPRAGRAATAEALEAYVRVRRHLATAEEGMKRAAEALWVATAELKQIQGAVLEPGLLISFAAVAEANGGMLENMGERIARLLSFEKSSHGPECVG